MPITIDQALHDMQEMSLQGQSFSLVFFGMDGDERTYARARWGALEPKTMRIGGASAPNPHPKKGFRSDGTIPITNLETNEFKTPKWFSIKLLNGEKIM